MTPGERRALVVLGATGSIGRSTLEVVRRHRDRFRVLALTARRSARELGRLAAEFEPEFVVLSDGEGASSADERAWPGEWRFGAGQVTAAARAAGADVVVNGLVGIAGLEPTLEALRAGRRLALANKESLVAGGELVLEALRSGGGELLPVDSEHSAIHQCLAGARPGDCRRLVLTASGGPFRTTPGARLSEVRRKDALEHPTWEMGEKVTIDSATLANKALEVVEAHHLFGVPYDRIDVVVHPSSVVHSFVELRDGSVLAQLGFPTMEIPILYALSWPERWEDPREPFDPVAASPLIFEPLRRDDFPMFGLGVRAGRRGGTAPALYNAANEVAVRAFLDGRIGFTDVGSVVASVLEDVPATAVETLADVWEADRRGRAAAARVVEGVEATGPVGR